MSISMILYLVALICFVCHTAGFPEKPNLQSLGLAFFMLGLILGSLIK